MIAEKKYKLGYTQGVFDMFHVGHLRLINRASELCETLIVGVNADVLVKEYKDKVPVICETERAEIISNLKSVSRCEIVFTLDKCELYQTYKFDAVFIGDDWKDSERWVKTERDLAAFGVVVVYLPHTPKISSSLLRGEISNRVE